jgi:hypothetical protein
MEATNFANRHEILGVGTHSSPNPTHHAARQTNDIYDNTVNPGPTLREKSGTGARDFAQGVPGNNSSAPVHNSGQQTRTNTIQATEIGNPTGRIPTAQDTHEQLDAARHELAAAQRNHPSATPKEVTQGVSQTHPGTTEAGGVPTSQRGHRNSNYAPGYEGAADAVKHKSHNAEDHRPSLLAHEPVTPSTEVPPDLGQTTQQAASSRGSGTVPGSSIGQKAKAPFAKIHVSTK